MPKSNHVDSLTKIRIFLMLISSLRVHKMSIMNSYLFFFKMCKDACLLVKSFVKIYDVCMTIYLSVVLYSLHESVYSKSFLVVRGPSQVHY